LSELKTDLSEFIAENFGANATYVETLLGRWRTDPALVDESWRTYFEELLGESTGAKTPDNGRAVTLPPHKPAQPKRSRKQLPNLKPACKAHPSAAPHSRLSRTWKPVWVSPPQLRRDVFR